MHHQGGEDHVEASNFFGVWERRTSTVIGGREGINLFERSYVGLGLLGQRLHLLRQSTYSECVGIVVVIKRTYTL